METNLTMIPINREKQEIAIYQNEGSENNQHRTTKNNEFSNTANKKDTPNRDSQRDSLGSSTSQQSVSQTDGDNNNNNNDLNSLAPLDTSINERDAENISPKTFKIALTVFLIGLVYIVQDIFTRKSFADGLSRDIIVGLQSGLSSTFLFDVSIVLSDSSFIITAGVSVIIIIWGTNRLHCFYYLLIFASASSFLSILKLLYNDPRPFMVYSDIEAKQCASEYGEPSGHAMLNLFVGLLFTSLITYKFPQNNKILCGSYGVYLFLVGLSRIHLGVHGVNQVVLGWVYAIVLFCLFRFLLFSYLVEFMRKLSRIPKEKQIISIIITVALYLVMLFTVLGIFLGVRGTYEESNNIWNPTISAACSNKSIEELENKYLYNKCYIDAGLFGASFGMILAMIMSRGSVDHCYKYGLSNDKITLLVKLKRLAVIAIVPGVIFLLNVIIFYQISTQQIQVRYFFYLNIIPAICAFIAVYVSPLLLQKLQLDIQGDFLRLHSSSPSTEQFKKIQQISLRIIQQFDLSISSFDKTDNYFKQALEIAKVEVSSTSKAGALQQTLLKQATYKTPPLSNNDNEINSNIQQNHSKKNEECKDNSKEEEMNHNLEVQQELESSQQVSCSLVQQNIPLVEIDHSMNL